MREKGFGIRLRELREARGLTQEEAASQIPISYRALQRHEYGFIPNMNNLKRYADFYEVNKGWLFTGDDEADIAQTVQEIPEAIYEDADDDDPEMVELLEMTREVLKSKTDYAYSLKANVRSFHRAMTLERKFQNHEQRITQIEQERVKKVEKIRETDPPGQKDELLRLRAI